MQGPGSGKSIFGWAHLWFGAKFCDAPGIIVSLELSPDRIIAQAARLGWDFQQLLDENKLRFIHTTPAIFSEEMQDPEGVPLER
ncbi:MAG: hypothetical protein EOO29_52000 [Comamonadaceae bacterium]|nr:MAG: hypothetical protein EOO29_52000 [Comamonadaceae bacterium]